MIGCGPFPCYFKANEVDKSTGHCVTESPRIYIYKMSPHCGKQPHTMNHCCSYVTLYRSSFSSVSYCVTFAVKSSHPLSKASTVEASREATMKRKTAFDIGLQTVGKQKSQPFIALELS